MKPKTPLPTSLDGHIQLLEDKGYLNGNFGEPATIGRWLQEFRERFDKCRFDALIQEKAKPIKRSGYKTTPAKLKADFTMTTYGKFNNQLEQVSFLLHYRYDPRKDTLSLLTVRTRFASTKVDPRKNTVSLVTDKARSGPTKCPYFLNGRLEPPTPEEAYEKLVQLQARKPDDKLIHRLRREYDDQILPSYDPYLHMEHPRFNQVNDLHIDPEYPDFPSNDRQSSPNRPTRLRG